MNTNGNYNQKQSYGTPVRSNGTSIVSLVFGILALVLCWVPILGLSFALVALITGICSKKGYGFLNGTGKAGVITGSVALGLSIILMIISVVSIILINNNNTKLYMDAVTCTDVLY